jgi:hypothetical protein
MEGKKRINIGDVYYFMDFNCITARKALPGILRNTSQV